LAFKYTQAPVVPHLKNSSRERKRTQLSFWQSTLIRAWKSWTWLIWLIWVIRF
jgi:hypothetical protein